MAESVSESSTDDAPLQPAGTIKPWASLSFPQFRMLLGSMVLGHIGMQMRQVTNLALVYELTGSPIHLGLLGVFQVVPLIVVGFIGGTVADTVNRKKLLVVTQSGMLSMAVLLAGLAFSGWIEVWHIYLITMVSAGLSSFDQPARMAIIPGIVPRSHFVNAITLNSSGRHAAFMLGPVMGGGLMDFAPGMAGVGIAYTVNALLFVPVVWALARMQQPRQEIVRRRNQVSLGEMLEGLRFVWSTRVVLALLILDTSSMLFTSWRVLMPIFADQVLDVGRTGLGALLGAPAAGFVAGSALLLLLGDIKRKGLVVLSTFTGYALAIIFFASSTWFWISLGAMFLVGALDGIGAILRQTMLQLMVPDAIRGRATAVLHMFNRGGPALGQILTGSVAAALGAPGALLLGAGISLLTIASIGVFSREVATYRD